MCGGGRVSLGASSPSPKAQAKTSAPINVIVDDALFLIKHHDRFRRIDLVRRMSEDLPSIAANTKQLIQVFLALMMNAIGRCVCPTTPSGVRNAPNDLAAVSAEYMYSYRGEPKLACASERSPISASGCISSTRPMCSSLSRPRKSKRSSRYQA